MRDLLNELIRQYDALEGGPSHPADWTAFVEQAQSVYERALILRYKSLERVQAEEPQSTTEPPVLVWSPEPADEAPESQSSEARSVEETAEVVAPTTTEEAPAPAAAADSPVAPAAQPAPGQGVSLAEKLSLQPLKSILPSLGINDRVRFAGALFGGDMQLLQQACAAAESAAGFDAAMEQVQQLAATGLDWNDEEEAPHQFMQLVQRVHL